MNKEDYVKAKIECLERLKRVLNQSRGITEVFDYTFDCAYALGKQEKDAEDTVISGWVARDNGGFISLFSYCPNRVIHDDLGYWGHNDGSDEIDLPKDSFPDLTWESDPEPVEIIIKRKKKNL